MSQGLRSADAMMRWSGDVEAEVSRISQRL